MVIQSKNSLVFSLVYSFLLYVKTVTAIETNRIFLPVNKNKLENKGDSQRPSFICSGNKTGMENTVYGSHYTIYEN